MHNDINTKRTELANQMAAAGAALLDFTGTAYAMAAIPDTEPQQYVAAGTPENIAAILPATIGPQRRQKHGERPTEPLQFDSPAATSGDAPDLQQLKALALAATPGPWASGWPGIAFEDAVSRIYDEDCHTKEDAAYIAAANPAVVLGLIARIEHEREVAASWQRTAEKKDRDWNEARMAFENYKCAQRAAAPATASGDELPPPFFYYRANKDGSVEWGEDCCCRDDVYTKEATAEEYETHGGKVYSESQVRALLATKPPAELSDAQIEEAFSSASGKWDGDRWVIEDADFHPFVRSLLATKPAAAPAVPEGFVLVPKVPTRDMIAKTVDAVFDGAIEDASVIEEVYAAMLAATPAASTTGAARTAEQALKFADDVITCAFDGGDLDGATIQEIAEARGLIRKTTQPEPCGEVCNCMEMGADFPAECFQKTYLSALRPTPTHSSEAGDA